jgi:hypothetical protein
MVFDEIQISSPEPWGSEVLLYSHVYALLTFLATNGDSRFAPRLLSIMCWGDGFHVLIIMQGIVQDYFLLQTVIRSHL